MKSSKTILTFTFLMLAFAFVTGCSDKEEDITPVFELRFTNTSSNPYFVEVNGTTDVQDGNSFKNYNLDKGTYAWKVTQKSGYILYPTVREGTITLDQDKEIVFP